MPLLNLSHVITSPMFADKFDVRRREASVSNKGRAVTRDTLFKKVRGHVVPDGDNTQDRSKDGAVGHKTIYITTKFRLRDQVTYSLPDIILWGGNEFLCESIEDMTQFGSGWTEATCTSQDMQDQPPKE
jgi:hypothetical protein